MSRRFLLVAALVLSPALASAGASKAWTAAKKVHADAPIIAGLDIASAKASESFKKFFPLLIKQKPDVQDVLDKLKAACNFDPFTAVNSLVAVIDDGQNNKGAFYIALNGWNAAKVGTCAQGVAKGENKELKVGPVKKGIQELEISGKSEHIYLGWIGKDVLVIATEPTDRTFVEAMVRGKGGGAAGKLAAKLDTTATAWMVVIKSQDIKSGITMKSLYGTVKIANGNIAADARMITGDATQASDLVLMFNTELPKVQSGLPPVAQAMVKSMTMKAAGAEVQTTANAPEKDVLALLSLVFGL